MDEAQAVMSMLDMLMRVVVQDVIHDAIGAGFQLATGLLLIAAVYAVWGRER